jgi:hypothetical protein
MDETATKRRSRFSNAPILNAQGHPRAKPPHALSETELQFIRALALDRLLSARFLAAVTGTSYKYAIRTVQVLGSLPYQYIRLCDEQADPAKHRFYLHSDRQFELAPLGIEVAQDQLDLHIPPRKRVQQIAHQIMSDQVMASFRIGVRESAGRFAMLTRNELLAHPNMPATTRERKYPDAIPLPDIEGVNRGEHAIRPDREMFVIRDKQRNKSFFFPGFEIGTGSEKHEDFGKHDHSFTQSKLTDYITILVEGIHESYFGSDDNFFIPFIEHNAARLVKPMLLLEKMTAKRPKLREHFLFGVQPRFTDIIKPQPDGHALTEDWQRVGYPAFNFTTS